MSNQVPAPMSSAFLSAWQESFDRLMKHFRTIDDLTLIVLKGHLLVEVEINEILRQNLSNADAINLDEFNFYKKLCIIQALRIPSDNLSWCWRAIRKLNTLRNQLAHNLEPTGVEQGVADISRMVEEGPRQGFAQFPDNAKHQALAEKARAAITQLIVTLSWQRAEGAERRALTDMINTD